MWVVIGVAVAGLVFTGGLVVAAFSLGAVIEQVTRTLGEVTNSLLNPMPKDVEPINQVTNPAMEITRLPWETWEPGEEETDPTPGPGTPP